MLYRLRGCLCVYVRLYARIPAGLHPRQLGCEIQLTALDREGGEKIQAKTSAAERAPVYYIR